MVVRSKTKKPQPVSKKTWTRAMAAHRKELSEVGYKEAFSEAKPKKWNFRIKETED